MTGGADDHGTVVIARDAAMPVVQRAREVQARSPQACGSAACILAVLFAVQPAIGAAATADVRLAGEGTVERTGKERLSDKGSDEQRTNDCKVPVARRTRARPMDCR